ncbi:MAG: hypothetical protein AAGG01_11120 [Planctomycetota bacterium]
MSHPIFALLACSILAATPASLAGPQKATTALQESAASEIAPLLRRVRLIGASVTAGYGTASRSEIRRNLPLEIFLECALAPRNAEADLDTSASNMFFQAPTLTGKRQATWAAQSAPTLVIALDFLFWYGFGVNTPQEPRRLAGLEKGLKALEAIEAPLIIGTLPNVDHAMEGKGPFGGPILSWSQIPSDESRKAMNTRILEWAGKRENVTVVDSEANLAAFVAGEEMKLGDETWKPSSRTSGLQEDLLHLSLDGYVWTALTLTDALARLEGAKASDFRQGRAAVRGAFDDYVEGVLADRAQRRKKSSGEKGLR